MAIRKLLIANRGEIACRIIRTCRRLGIFTVAVYSDADARALHVTLADEAVHLGGAPATESYLNIEAILRAARLSGADAVHPGFGFLAENPTFARAVTEAGLIWIGPPPEAMEAMGDKRRAKLTLRDIPVVPGYSGEDQSDEALLTAAAQIGYPIMVKAAAGGGGKGMRRVDSAEDLLEALEGARREAAQAFGDPTLLLEKYIVHPRHVEVQIMGDRHGGVIALGERECSIQRRHQKIIEESPSTALDDDLRARMCAAAVSIGQQIGYISAGTVEFILDQQRNFYFLEMNTRLQVEHPVTEMRSGFDLVEWQIRIAEGATLFELSGGFPDPLELLTGHAIEVRLYAEDPANGFLPSIGTILAFDLPDADPELLRVDSGIQTGDAITIHYDPMIAKIIAWGETRAAAAARLDHALGRLTLLGLRHNAAYLRRVLMHPDYLAGNIDTGFIAHHPELLADPVEPPAHGWIAAALAWREQRGAAVDGLPAANWRSNPYRPERHTLRAGDMKGQVALTDRGGGRWTVELNGTQHAVQAAHNGAGRWQIGVDGHRMPVVTAVDGNAIWVGVSGHSYRLEYVDPLPAGRASRESVGSLRSPMPGQVIRVNVSDGQAVKQGDVLLIIEAMKMEHRIRAPYDGIVTHLRYGVGQSVQAGVILLDLEASDQSTGTT
ncbi:MAG: ATP-binding protein [Candidatus Flexifilum sp.]